MRTFAELESLWQQGAPPPRGAGTVRLIVQRKGNDVHELPDRAAITTEQGLQGDRWSTSGRRDPQCQVTLMNALVAKLITAGEQPLHMPGDNILVDLDLSQSALPAGTRVRLGSATLEITDTPHSGCQKFAARFGQDALRWVNWKDHRERRLRGVNCRVVAAGEVALGDRVEVQT